MAGPSCSPPKSVSVRDYFRTKPRSAKRKAQLAYVVRNTRTGTIVSRHRTWGAATREARRRDLQSYRKGQGRPFEAGKA